LIGTRQRHTYTIMTPLDVLSRRISECTLCAERFQATETAHSPRPVVYPSSTARVLVAGQAPGARVHASGIPFDDPSGDRLRDWMGIDRQIFYDKARIAILPMAFCFPGYDGKGADLPPPKICAETWHGRLLGALRKARLTLLVGGYAHRFHLGARDSVTATVARWRDYGPSAIPLPHPSWRNTGWLKANPWFTAEVLPSLRSRVSEALG
jgi:uracil-DNA glycosylase